MDGPHIKPGSISNSSALRRIDMLSCRQNVNKYKFYNFSVLFYGYMFLGILKYGYETGFVDQVTGSARNQAHSVPMTFYCPNDLKFGIKVC